MSTISQSSSKQYPSFVLQELLQFLRTTEVMLIDAAENVNSLLNEIVTAAHNELFAIEPPDSLPQGTLSLESVVLRLALPALLRKAGPPLSFLEDTFIQKMVRAT